MSSALAFVALFAISLCVWLALKPFFPKVTFTVTFERVAMGWLLGAAAIWMVIIYTALGVAVCAGIMVLANLVGASATLEHVVRWVARDYLGFLPLSAAELWPAFAFGAVACVWSILSARKDKECLQPLSDK